MNRLIVNNCKYLGLLLSAGLIAGAMSGCSEVTSTTEGTSTAGDSTVPTVTVSPVDGATGIERNTVITATFNEDMFASTIDDTSFTLSDGSSVTGTVSFDAATNVATFTPSSDLAILSSHTGSLSTSITDLAGNALAALSWSFTTRDGAWGTAALIETDDTANATTPQIAFDTSGNAIAVWSQSDGTQYDIWANYYTSGSGWGTAELIETDDTADANTPQVAFDSSGNAIAVWSQSTGSRIDIRYNRYTSGSGWGSAADAENGGSGDASNPQIAFDSSDNAMAVWSQVGGGRTRITANFYTSGSGWGTEAVIESTANNATIPQIAFDASGNAIAVWSHSDGTRTNIMANRYSASTWGTEALIESDDTGDATNPQIAVDSSGNAIAVWSQTDGTRTNIMANRYSSSTWGTEAAIESTANNATIPQIAFDTSGNAIAVWSHSDGTRTSIMANRYSSSAWGTEALIESDDTGGATNPQIAFDANGNAIAVWSQTDGTRTNIWANRYASGWGTAATIETDNTADATIPQIAIDTSGNALAVWSQSDGTRTNIWSNLFE